VLIGLEKGEIGNQRGREDCNMINNWTFPFFERLRDIRGGVGGNSGEEGERAFFRGGEMLWSWGILPGQGTTS